MLRSKSRLTFHGGWRGLSSARNLNILTHSFWSRMETQGCRMQDRHFFFFFLILGFKRQDGLGRGGWASEIITASLWKRMEWISQEGRNDKIFPGIMNSSRISNVESSSAWIIKLQLWPRLVGKIKINVSFSFPLLFFFFLSFITHIMCLKNLFPWSVKVVLQPLNDTSNKHGRWKGRPAAGASSLHNYTLCEGTESHFYYYVGF